MSTTLAGHPPQIIFMSSSDKLHQLGVVGHHVVGDITAILLVEGGEELAGAVDLRILYSFQLEGRK